MKTHLPTLMRALLLLALGVPLTVRADAPLVAPTEALTPEEEKAKFRLPPGFEAQLVTAEPHINKPMNLAFDARGRLWVTTSLEYPFPAKLDAKAGKLGRDRVVVLSDFDPATGLARKAVNFVEGLNIPIGLLPDPDGNGCLVFTINTDPAADIGEVRRYRDTDGDGKADRYEVVLTGLGYKRDTHGNTSSFLYAPDGYVYACHGFNNISTIRGTDGGSITLESGNTYRFRPDGTKLEQYTWGQVNPFGLCMDRHFNIFSADCHSKPLTLLLRGGWYSSFGRQHDGLGFVPEICRHGHGSTGIAGVVIYEAEHFPAEFRGGAFLGNVVTSRINRDKFDWKGSTPLAVEQPDFLVSDDPWFRPVDLKLGPDGALYVADFYNCIIGHYEVPLTHPRRDRTRGRIWRIVYRGPDGKGPEPAPPTDLTVLSLRELYTVIGSENLTANLLAVQEFVRRQPGHEALTELRRIADPTQRLMAMATCLAHRSDWKFDLRIALSTEATKRTKPVRGQPDDVLLARLFMTRSYPEPEEFDPVGQLALQVTFPMSWLQRASADVLSNYASAAAVPDLAKALAKCPAEDTQLRYMLRIALRNQFRDGKAFAGLADKLGSDAALSRAVADIAVAIPTSASAAFLAGHLARNDDGPARTADQLRHVARYGDEAGLSALIAAVRKRTDGKLPAQAELYRAVLAGLAQRGGAAAEPVLAWGRELAGQLLADPDANSTALGCELAGSLKLTTAAETVKGLLLDAGRPEAVRRAAALALPRVADADGVATLRTVLLSADQPQPIREAAAESLGLANSEPSRAALAEALPVAPAQLQRSVALALANSRPGAELLLKLVAAGKASARLLQSRTLTERLRQHRLGATVDKLTAGLPPADAAAAALIARRADDFRTVGGDAALGKLIFAKTCANCHQIGGQGGKVGPQLDGVGIRGPDRLTEDVLDPSRNVDEAFRTTLLRLDDDRIVSGLLLRVEGATLVIADQQGKELTISRESVVEQKRLPSSPMPGNFADIGDADFRNLLAYLLTQRVAPPPAPAEKRDPR